MTLNMEAVDLKHGFYGTRGPGCSMWSKLRLIKTLSMGVMSYGGLYVLLRYMRGLVTLKRIFMGSR